MNDVLLVVPPFHYRNMDSAAPICPRIGVASLAAVLEKAGYKVGIIDAPAERMSVEQIREVIQRETPRIVGVTASTAEFADALEILKLVKEHSAKMITVVGGPHITMMPETGGNRYIDYIVLGEGEVTFLELVNMLLRNQGEVSGILGLGYKNNDKLVLNAARPLIEDLDTLPFPAYHLLPMDKYRNYATLDEGRKFATMVTSRGCPFSCTFCSSFCLFGHRWRTMSVKRILELMEKLYTEYKIRFVYFHDDEFSIDKKRVAAICDGIIDRGWDLKWSCLMRVSDMDEDLTRKMKQAGMAGVSFGIELGYAEGLKTINKKITLEQARAAVRLCGKYDIISSVSFMMGFPWESAKEIRETIDFALSLKEAGIYYFQTLIPYPGTDIYKVMKEEGLIVSGDWSNYVTHTVTGSEPIIKTRYLSSKELQELYYYAVKRAYFQPGYLFKRLSHIRNWTNFRRQLGAGWGLARNVLAAVSKKK